PVPEKGNGSASGASSRPGAYNRRMVVPKPPDVQPEPGWKPCDPFPASANAAASFVSGGPTGGRLRVAYFQRTTDARLVGRAWFGPETQGPPGHAHGGSIAAVLDEALGAAAWAAGHPVLVASLVVDFRRMVPLGTDATFEAWIDRTDGRKIHTCARLTDDQGIVLAEGRALCVTLSDEHVVTLAVQAGY
ncbi:MAG: PaaI family thioesterase, partial [Vicinamibacterales bacterium]